MVSSKVLQLTNKFIACVLLIILTTMVFETLAFRNVDVYESSMKEQHERWITRHNRMYENEVEKERRYQIYKNNVERIEQWNKNAARNNLSYRLGVNKFADLNEDEFHAVRNGYKRATPRLAKSVRGGVLPSSPSLSPLTYEGLSDVVVPSSMDWREKGAVTRVKDQGQCGRMIMLSKGELVSLSEQQIIDCDERIQHGCKGGYAAQAFSFIQQNNGLVTEAAYPYRGAGGRCRKPTRATTNNNTARIGGYERVPLGDEEALLQAVAKRPVSAAIDASRFEFWFYSSGVYTGPCATELNHEVAIVGYGVSEDGVKYWLVKNSWGESWGEDGYMRMQRDVDEGEEGLCGIALDASYPIAPSSDQIQYYSNLSFRQCVPLTLCCILNLSILIWGIYVI
ncbi:hypothetical protein MKW94_008633 [Papaver nudicaule]|uniref:Uncharacterized protein n=1 Tax=Papaver nudicaule TaxID=74823 RepID=A0AA41SGP5_PAPNU|nr:hypothetical protein [Papaver nudicaule]